MSDAPPTPPPGDPPPEPEPQPEPTTEPVIDPAKVLSDNRRLGKEAADLRKAVKEANAQIEELTKKGMTEIERLRLEWSTEAAEAERNKWVPVVRQLRLAQAAVGRTSDPELAAELLSKIELNYDDDDAVIAAIDALVEKHPTLAAPTAPPSRTSAFEQGPRGNGQVTNPDMNDMLFDAFGMKRRP